MVGVAPPEFPDFDLDNPQMWLLIDQIDRLNPGTTIKDDWTSLSIELYGRLRDGVSLEAATEGLRPAVAALYHLQPKRFKPDERFVGGRATDRFNRPEEFREMTMTAGLVAALPLLVLLVASANLANFILSRAIARLREFSIRAALGATRSRIFRQILVECAVLTAAAAACAIGLSWAGARIIAAGAALPPYLDFTPDRSLFVAAFIVSLLAMLAFGVAPAWMVSRRDLTRAIKDGGQDASSSLVRARFRLTLVGAQVLGCCTLLIVAGAIFQGLRQLLETDPGFRTERAALLDVSLTRHGIAGENARAYWMHLQQTLAPNSQFAAVELAYPAPLGGALSTTGYPEPDGLTTTVMQVGPRFFEVLEIPLLAGRTFTPTDGESVVIVSRRLALRLYGSIDVIGKRFPQPHSTRTIVGVAGDAALFARRGNFAGEEYVPLEPGQYAEAVLVARGRIGAESLLDPLRQAARLADARVLPRTVRLQSAYDARFRAPRLARLISGLVAALVLALACLGIGGVVAYAVKVRTKEIGIRRALGADARRVCALLLRQLAVPVGVGLAAGAALGVAASQTLAGEPFYLTAPDTRGSVFAILIFVLAALIAALAPASRALAIDPVHALRHE